MKVLSGRLTGEVVSAFDAFASLWRSDTQLWFFGFLIVASVLAVLAKPWDGLPRVWATLLVCLISLVFWGIGVPAIFGSPIVFFGLSGWGLLGFFILGAGWTHQGVTGVLDRIGKNTLFAAAVGLTAFMALNLLVPIATPTESPERTIASVAMGVATSALGVLTLLLISRLFSTTLVAAPLVFIGKHSLEIFLAHIIAASGTRAILSKIGIYDFMLHLIAGTLAGVALPLLLWWIADKINIHWLFKLPKIRQRSSV